MTLPDLSHSADHTGLDESSPSQSPTQPASVAGTVTTARRTTITFYLNEALRNRARAAYRSTSFAENDSSWSEMLNKALLAEVERREAEHNSGKRFAASEAPLSAGRPIGY